MLLPRVSASLALHLLAPFMVAAAQPQPTQRLRSSAFGVPGTNASFDYIVVGGGTAGLAIASRLAETASVAVIEAGGLYEFENGNWSVVPSLALIMPVLSTAEVFPQQPLVDWGLVTLPVAEAGNQKVHYAQGKTLGGSSALNTMAYTRSTVGAYQRWADVVGDQSYAFPNLLQYFIKSAHLTPPNLQKRNTPNATVLYDPSAFNNNEGGPLQVSWGNWVDPTQTWFARALQAVGLPLSPTGLNSGILSGFGGWTTSTISPDDAHRSSSQTSYLNQAIEKTGIIVYVHTQATKILFDASKKASAVAVSTQGLEYTLSANKEIIVSAGVFHSPQLLMVSGIGPGSTLQAHGIPVLSDLPGVGQNLWDPIFIDILWEVNTPCSGSVIAANPSGVLQEYLHDAAGPYSSAGGYFSYEKLPSDLRANFTNRTAEALQWFPPDWPEINELGFGFPDGKGGTIGVMSAALMAPLSRGNVTITSSSMSDPPAITLGWLSDPADAEVAIAAVKRARQIWDSPPGMAFRVGAEISPGAAISSDEAILSFVRQSAQPLWHASSTCAMGKAGNPQAVVDSAARVFGVRGLRVVDHSAFPFGIPGEPQSSVYMFAEKIADAIKAGK